MKIINRWKHEWTTLGFWLSLTGLIVSIIFGLIGTDSFSYFPNKNRYEYYTIDMLVKNVDGFEQALDNLVEKNPELQMSNFKVFTANKLPIDLNFNGYPELVHTNLMDDCGATGNCMGRVFSYVADNGRLDFVTHSLPTSRISLTGRVVNGWAEMANVWRMGACEYEIGFFRYRWGDYEESGGYTDCSECPPEHDSSCSYIN